MPHFYSSSLLEETEEAHSYHMKTLQAATDELLMSKHSLAESLKKEQIKSAEKETKIQKLQTLAATNHNFGDYLERERIRWKQSSDEIIYDLM